MCAWVCGVRAEGAEVYHGSYHSRKLSRFYEFLLRVWWTLSVFWGILGMGKKAQRMCASQMGWFWVLPAEQLFSSLSQKSHPSRSKSHFSTGEAACLLARETEESVRSRNKKATGGGWEGRKDNNSQSKRSDRSSRSSSCIIPDTGTAFFFFSYPVCCSPMCL